MNTIKQTLFLVLFSFGCCVQAAVTSSQGKLQQTFGASGISKPALAGGGTQNLLNTLKIYNDSIFGGGFIVFDSILYPMVYKFSASSGALLSSNYLIGFPNSNVAEVGVAFDENLLACGTVTISNQRFMVSKFLSDEYMLPLDTRFGSGGISVFSGSTAIAGGADDICKCCVVQPDGKIVLGGYSGDTSVENHFALVRYNSDGSLDRGFGGNGTGATFLAGHILSDGTSDTATCIGLQSDGKIIIAGQSTNGVTTYFSLARYTINGVLDITFGNGGKACLTTTIAGGVQDECNCLLIQSDNKIILGGSSLNSAATHTYFALARFTADGILDTTFGANKTGLISVNTNIGGGSSSIGKSLGQDVFGNIILGGTSNNTYAFACFDSNGITNISFGDNGFQSIIMAGGVNSLGVINQGNLSYIIGGGSSGVFVGLLMLNNTPLIVPDSSLVPTTALSPAQLVSVQTNGVAAVKGDWETQGQLENQNYKNFVSAFTTSISNGKSLSVAYDAALNVFPNNLERYIISSLKRYALSGNFNFLNYKYKLTDFLTDELDANFETIANLTAYFDRNFRFTISNYPLPYACALYVAGYVNGIAKSGAIGL